MADSKDTIYIDIDDEITGIIDKVRGSSSKVTALVLPKRAGVFQSIVNMKLLKRAADEANKNLVLITAEAGLLPLAGAAGIHVAKTLNSKPAIPAAPKLEETADEAIDEAGEVTAANAGDQPVGKLAEQPPSDNGVETLQLDDDELPEDAAAKPPTPKKPKDFAAGAGAADKAAKGKGKGKGKSGSKFKIPNFGTFRKKLIFGGIILFLLILALILGLIVLPKATINVKTDATNIPAELNLNLSTTETQLDTSSDTPTVPAKLASEQKTFSQQVPTTGQKNHGNKASGNVTITNCSDDITLPAGTGFSSGGNTYISQQSVTVPASNFNSHSQCKNDGKATVNVQAQSGGSSSNLPSGATFTISGGSSNLSAQGDTISGGTDNIVQTVNQNDITNAKAKIATNDDAQKKALQNDLKSQGQFAITSTFSPGTPNVTQSAGVGDVANNVTVTEVITYTMFGAKEKDLDKLVDGAVKNQVDTSKQTILSEGLDTAVFGVNTSSTTGAQLTLQTTAVVGPDLNVAAIKQSAFGKKPADVKSQLQGNPDVTDVNVKLSPFWVSSVPKKASKVKVTIAKPTTTKSTHNANNSP
jgi:hypothetical protein